MKCQQCGVEIAPGAAFCQSCGRELAPAKPQEPSAKERLAPAATRRGAEGDREVVLWEGRYSKLAMLGAWVAAGVLTLAGITAGAMLGISSKGWWIVVASIVVMWAYFLLRLLYLQYTVRYSLTNQRFIHERGLLWRQIDRIETIDIDDVIVQQGPIERMMGVGTVRLVSSDQTTPEFEVIGIEDVRRVATIIDDARRQERRKRAVHIESF